MIQLDPLPLGEHYCNWPEHSIPKSYKQINPPGGLDVKIFNATDFDTAWLRKYIMGCAKKAGINWKIYFWFVEYGWSEKHKWIGTSNCFDEFICQIPPDLKFGIFDFNYRRSLTKDDLCKIIIGHELCHATYGHPENFIIPVDCEDTKKMESCCNDFAFKFLYADL